MASIAPKIGTLNAMRPALVSRLSTSSASMQQRFGDCNGSSGWKWENNGVGMGGKTSDKATEIKPDCGKGKTYQVPEYYGYNTFSYFELEKDMSKQRLPQPKSGLTEFW